MPTPEDQQAVTDEVGRLPNLTLAGNRIQPCPIERNPRWVPHGRANPERGRTLITTEAEREPVVFEPWHP